MSIVICKLPKAGLGNQLFPLLNAYTFAKLNNLPVIVIGYHQFKIGPYLRREKTKRNYHGYFTFEKNMIGEWLDKMKVNRIRKTMTFVHEPAIEILSNNQLDNKAFIFEKMPTYHDYFGKLKNHRERVKQIFSELLTPKVKTAIENSKIPTIGVHIRMGDFRKLSQGEVFKGGHVRTPENYFTDIIKAVRKINEKDNAVTVFTDGYENEFEELFTLGNVTMSESKTDIGDLILLSKSQLIISSTGSTFSAWAGFLSDSPFIKHPDHLNKSFRPEVFGEQSYEGPFLQDNHLLLQQIKQLQ